ncbi:MAG: hypothetical protein J6I84_04830 [Bacilli bacterium]|nr:hypothetical protein [Bacilli bacterium]
MGTLIKFRQKKFGKVEKFLKTPAGIISTTGLAVSSANLTTNVSRHRNDKKYQENQIEAMNKLTSSIKGLDKTVKGVEKGKENLHSFITFKPKHKK